MTKATDLFATAPGEGEIASRYAGLSVQFKVPSDVTGGQLAIIEFVLEPRRLVPPHTHRSEDELSYVIDGEIGVRVGDTTISAQAGTYVYKPRDVLHTFWNASDRPARILEIVYPAGFEESFRESADAVPATTVRTARQPNVHDDTWVPDLKRRYGLKLIGEP
jgi:quercetin dioxygenase-like cupin family protein